MLELPTPLAVQPVISVSELNRLAKDLLERSLPLMWIRGEISNLKRYDSGHCYFTLKDAQAQVDCVMFRHKLQYLDWVPENGMQVEIRACPTLYEARGKFQLNVETLRRSGLGALFEAFAKLKARLEREGLFDPAHKRPLPVFPRTIGVVTSLQAAALRDVLTTLGRRMPGLSVIVYPTPVQGEGAAQKIAAAIATAAARGECDVLVLCRGGGSIEDLWAFNEEIVARAIYACSVPIVTGIGHDTDFTIADFVADARGPTPTGAAALATPDCAELRQQLLHWHHRLGRVTMRGLEERMQHLDYLGRRLVHPGERISGRLEGLRQLANRMRAAWQYSAEQQRWQLRALRQCLSATRPDVLALQRSNDERARRLKQAARARLEAARAALSRVEAHLKHLSPHLVLERGYSITVTKDGSIVRDSNQVECGEEVSVTFAKGWAGAEVKRKG